MKSVMMNATFALCIGVSGMACAHAAELGGARQHETVSYGDLDLSREAGARVMLDRLQLAASKVCGSQPDMHSLERTMRYRSCLRQAMDGAVARVGSPAVDALYGRPDQRLALQR
jgi:UrcA family protein